MSSLRGSATRTAKREAKTKLKKAVQETDFSRLEQPGRLQLIADALPALVGYMDRDQRYLFNNKSFEAWFGYPRQKMYRQHIRQVVGREAYTILQPHIKRALRGQQVSFETWIHYKRRGRRCVAVSYVPDRDPKGRVTGLISLVTDITSSKEAEAGQRFLTEASEVLSSSLDYHATLRHVAQLAVPNLADWCSVDMRTDTGGIERVAVAHKDPKKVKWAHALQRKYPVDANAPTGVPNVLRTGVSELIPHITDEMLVQATTDKKMLQLLRHLGLTSVMIVPIAVGKKVSGAISFVSTELGRHYHQGDVELAEELARHAGLAIENAQLYQAAQQQRERLDSLMTSVPGIVWEAWGKPDAATQRIDFVSEYVKGMLGYTVEEWLSTPNFWLKIVHPDDKERAAAEALAMYRTGQPGQSQFRWIAKNGRTIWVEAHSVIIKDKKGVPVGMRGVNIDITRLKEAEQRKDEFISMASHELKTPVTTLKLYTQILQRGDAKTGSPLTSQPYLQKMDVQLNKLNKLISDLLDITKMQANKLELAQETIDMNSLAKEVADAMQLATNTHRIKLQGKITRKVKGDRDRLGQVLTNLISNATKYSPRANLVTIRLSQTARDYKIAVQDFGIGISAAQQRKIFTRFYRVYEGDEKTYPGLGIGLYISQQIVQRHGGAITVRSSLKKGSTFLVSLPLAGPPKFKAASARKKSSAH